MTRNQDETVKAATEVAISSRIERIIEDPFASAIAASISCLTAITFVVSGIFLVQAAIY